MATLYANWINNWENELATKDTNRVVRPFDWGSEWLMQPPTDGDATDAVLRLVEEAVGNSQPFFSFDTPSDYRLDGGP